MLLVALNKKVKNKLSRANLTPDSILACYRCSVRAKCLLFAYCFDCKQYFCAGETGAASCFFRHNALHVPCFPNVISSTLDWSLLQRDGTLRNDPVFGTKKVTAALIRQQVVNRGLWRDNMRKRGFRKSDLLY